MPTLEFKGKQFIYSHHLSVPFRELKVDVAKSLPAPGQKPSLDDNLIIHGDNLEALKALLPTHAGKIDCIFIDPPYNTGGDWCYNDNVAAPLMKEWLKESANPVDKEDMERHDKWLSMMWPRMQLMKELMSPQSLLGVTIDDNELENLVMLLNDVFGEEKKLVIAPWLSEPSGGREKSGVRTGHEYLVIYRNEGIEHLTTEMRDSGELNLKDKVGVYRKGRELMKWGGTSLRSDRPNQWYPLPAPDSTEAYPIRNDGQEGHWRWGKENSNIKKALREADYFHWEMRPFDNGCHYKGKKERWVPYVKIRKEGRTVIWGSWLDSHGYNADGTRELKEIFGKKVFDTPKPTRLIEWFLSLHRKKDAIVLDSFTGSGTTAHATMLANRKDKGNRRFILIQLPEDLDPLSEGYKAGFQEISDITRERVKKVITGYEFTGIHYDELYKERITWNAFEKKHAEILDRVESMERLEGAGYDSVKKEIKNGTLTVTGERRIEKKVPGLDGSFTFCTLGEPIAVESLLTGKGLPAFETLARYVFYTATGRSLETVAEPSMDGFIGETELFRIHLFYQPDTAWLRSNEAALNADRVEAVAKGNTAGKRAVVFAVAKFMSQKVLTARRIEFCQLPYAVHRILGD